MSLLTDSSCEISKLLFALLAMNAYFWSHFSSCPRSLVLCTHFEQYFVAIRSLVLHNLMIKLGTVSNVCSGVQCSGAEDDLHSACIPCIPSILNEII